MGAVAQAGQQPTVHVGIPSVFGGSAPVDVMQPGQKVGLQYRGKSLLRRAALTLPGVDVAGPMAPAEKKALKVVQKPQTFDPTDHVTTAVLMNPGPKLQTRIQSDPALAANHQTLRTAIGGPSADIPNEPSTPPLRAPADVPMLGRPGHEHPAGAMAQFQQEQEAAAAPAVAAYNRVSGGGGIVPGMRAEDIAALRRSAEASATSNPLSPAALIPNLATETAHTLTGVGPGLYHVAGGMIHDPIGTTAKLAQAIGHSYGQTIAHPERQLEQDPLGFITNILTPMFAGAGAGVRAAELTKTAQALRAGEITKLQAVSMIGKTLMRPQTMEREINAGGVRVNPPAFKSSLGGLLQTKVLDPLTERAVGKDVSLTRGTVKAVGREFKVGDQIQGMLPEGKVGAMKRRDVEMQMQMRRGMAEAKGIPPDKASAIGAAQTHLDLWHSLYHGGAGHDESYMHDPNAYVAIRKPPDQVKATGYTSEAGIARQFKQMVETNPKKIEADPHAYSFIPKGTWQRMQLYRPGTGALAKAADVIDRGTQMIRIGRFLHPGYVAWAAQNGILHASQAGMFAFRNAWQLRNEYPRLTPVEKAAFDNAVGAGHFGGGIARASQGSETSKFSGLSQKLGGFWHKIDDAPWRRMSLIHELNHAGYHSAEDWAHLMRTNPTKFRTIARGAQKEAIDYTEMSPSERATLQKLFTAYGWIRGATSYTARFPLQHPIQARVAEEVGREGSNQVDNFYAGHNGMVPNWLRGFLPIGHSNQPFLLGGSTINPMETPAALMEETPGLTHGQTESLSTEFAPVPGALEELMRGQNRYGTALKGSARYRQPISDLAHRFEPYSALQTLLGSKRGGGTTLQGPLAAAEQFGGVPVEQLRNADTTAALGMKDYEQALDKPELINFRYQLSLNRLGQEQQLFHQHTGTAPQEHMMGRIRGDLEAVHDRDMFQYNYAKSKGANSYRSLPAVNKAQAALSFLTQHRYITPQRAAMLAQTISHLTDDKQLEQVASDLWSDTGIGAISNEWQRSIKELQPPTLTPPRG